MTIEERLERLEGELSQAKRRTTWLLLGLAGLTFLGVSVWSVNRGVAREVRARAFILEDQNGRRRGGLAAAENNSTALVLSDEAGEHLVTLATSGSLGTSLVFVEKQKLRLVLGTIRDGQQGLSLNDENGKARFSVGVVQQATALRMDDDDGKSRVLLGNTLLGPMMALSDENGQAFWVTPSK